MIADFRLTMDDWHGRLESSGDPKTQPRSACRPCRWSVDNRRSQIENLKPRSADLHKTQVCGSSLAARKKQTAKAAVCATRLAPFVLQAGYS
jgi:hypothetical protein